MFSLSKEYYERKCSFKRSQVPTQSVMKKKMGEALAAVYFKSMTPKLKVLAGLEPKMRGGGSDWYMPPHEILQSRAVLKPIKKEYLSKLGFNGIDAFGERILKHHFRQMHDEKVAKLEESDTYWKKKITVACREQWEDSAKEAAKENTQKILEAFREFQTLYTTYITKMESILVDASKKEIERVREETFTKMKDHYKYLLKEQATMLYDRYAEKLRIEKSRLKSEFLSNVNKARAVTYSAIKDIHVEKHMAIEKLRHLLACRSLACQVYVALKEKEFLAKEIEESKHEHKKKVKLLKDEIDMKNFEIHLAKEKEKKKKEFTKIWETKVCHVVKKLQMFVSYCLQNLPEHAEFFMNMEKLMMLQLDEALETPSAESIFEPDEKHSPVAHPKPFVLFGEIGPKPIIHEELCPKVTSSNMSNLPVIVINKHCIYTACDNMEVFRDKMKAFLDGNRGNELDFQDGHDYTKGVPVKCTESLQRQELKLESSLMQILQTELPNLKNVPVECCQCNLPYCFSCLRGKSPTSVPATPVGKSSSSSISSGTKIKTRSIELEHEREPRLESYLNYVVPKCRCAKIAKKHLTQHLPSYMRTTSMFEPLDLPDYEPCSVRKLKKLVKNARRKPVPPSNIVDESNKKDAEIQTLDLDYDFLCACFSDEEIEQLMKELTKVSTTKACGLVTGEFSESILAKKSSSFATERAYSLRHLIKESPDLVEIFNKRDCD